MVLAEVWKDLRIQYRLLWLEKKEMITPGLFLDAFDVDALVHLTRALVLLGFSGIC